MSVLVALQDPWLGSIAQVIVVCIVLGYDGLVGTILQWAAVLLSYFVLSIDGGPELVTLSIVMSGLMDTLTMLITTATRTISLAVVAGALLAVAIVSGLTLSI